MSTSSGCRSIYKLKSCIQRSKVKEIYHKLSGNQLEVKHSKVNKERLYSQGDVGAFKFLYNINLGAFLKAVRVNNECFNPGSNPPPLL